MTYINGHFDIDAYRTRLRLLRMLHNMNQTQFAAFVGIDYKRWSHYERGYPLPREAAFLLREKVPSIPVAWVWFGDTAGLATSTLRRLRLLAKEEAGLNVPELPSVKLKVHRRVTRADKKRR